MEEYVSCDAVGVIDALSALPCLSEGASLCFRAVFSYLKNQKATIFNLQETFSKQEDEKAWSAEWGGKIIFSHGSEHSKGVSILGNPNSTFQPSTVEIDSHGRYIIAKLQIEETIFFLVDIYAPNEHREQEQ